MGRDSGCSPSGGAFLANDDCVRGALRNLSCAPAGARVIFRSSDLQNRERIEHPPVEHDDGGLLSGQVYVVLLDASKSPLHSQARLTNAMP